MARIDQFIFNALAHARDSKYVVVYDISEDRERLQIADLLGGFGVRVQYSVFECRMTKRRLGELIGEIDKTSLKTGFVKIYKLDHSAKMYSFGVEKEGGIDLDEDCIVI